MKLFKITLALLLTLFSITYVLAQSPTYKPKHEIPKGIELVAVYIGANDCVPCHDANMKNAFRKMKDMLAERSAKKGQRFAVTGVSLDWDVETGIKFLSDIGPFDQVIIGKNWTNNAALEYIWNDPSGQPAIPQIVIFQREVRETEGRISMSGFRVLKRQFGAKGIINWISKGALIDDK